MHAHTHAWCIPCYYSSVPQRTQTHQCTLGHMQSHKSTHKKSWTHTHGHTHTQKHTRPPTITHAHTHVHAHMHARTPTHTHTHSCTLVHTHNLIPRIILNGIVRTLAGRGGRCEPNPLVQHTPALACPYQLYSHYGTQWNKMEQNGTKWNLLEPFGTFWNAISGTASHT